MLGLSSDAGSVLSVSVAFSKTCTAMASCTTSKDIGSGEMLFEVPYKARYYSYAGKHQTFSYLPSRMEAVKSSHFLRSRTTLVSDISFFSFRMAH